MKCFKCGAELREESKFCSKCGEPQGFSDELINRAKCNDQNAVAELYNRTYNNVYFTVKSLIKSEDIILDIVQDSYVKAFQNLSQLQEANKFRAWIKRIAHNRAVDYLRKTKPVMFSTMSTEEDSVVGFEDDRTENLPEVVIDQKETTRLIKEILDTLSDDQRLVVGMFYYEQLSVKEIAQTLGISENTVKSRLSYGRKKIEIQVRELEKKGTKLYSLAPLPFLLLLFRNMDANAAVMPNMDILQNIQHICSSSMSNASANTTAESALSAAKTFSSNAVKTATAAGKGIASKVIAAVLAVGVIGGAAAGIIAMNKNNSNQQSASNSSSQISMSSSIIESSSSQDIREQTVSEQEVYQPILDEYSEAIAQGYFDENEFANINQLMMTNYYNYIDYYTGFYYDFYDIDSNGTDELIISAGSNDRYFISDVYSIKDNKPNKLIYDYSLGERSQLYIFQNGKMIIVGSGGYDSHSVTVYTFKDNDMGTADENVNIEGAFDLDSVLTEKSGGQQPIENFDWKPIEIKPATDTFKDISECIGSYMNGNDWYAGLITITEGTDSNTATITLETFKNRSDTELSKIFEGTASVESGAIMIQIDGEPAAMLNRSNYGFYLTAMPSFEAEWDLDPYVYEGEYVSIS